MDLHQLALLVLTIIQHHFFDFLDLFLMFFFQLVDFVFLLFYFIIQLLDFFDLQLSQSAMIFIVLILERTEREVFEIIVKGFLLFL